MGLDSVELVIAYEDAFGIAISDADATRMGTPRDVIDYFLPRLIVADRAPCLHMSAFHLVRRGVGQHLGPPRQAFQLDTRLGDLVPEKDRRDTWQALGRVLGVKLKSGLGRRPWPVLARPWWVRAALLAAGVGAFTATVMSPSLAAMSGGERFWLAAAVAGAALYVGALLTRALKDRFPADLTTVRHLVERLVASVPHAGKAGRQAWTPDQVEWVVRRVTIDVLGISDFRLDDQFVRDLGVG